jgi:hypothetical protein
LDKNGSRILDVGIEIPNAEQVLDMIVERKALEEYQEEQLKELEMLKKKQQNKLRLGGLIKTGSKGESNDDNEEKDDAKSTFKHDFEAVVAQPQQFDHIWNKLQNIQQKVFSF